MIYKYTIKASDLMTLNNNYSKDEPNKKKSIQRLKLLPVLVVIGMLVANYLTRGYFNLAASSVMGIFLVLWYLYADRMLNFFMERRLNKLMNAPHNKWLTKERTMSLMDDHFVETIEGADSSKTIEMKYFELNRVDMTNDAIYLFIDETNSYIMPIRAFKDKNEMSEVFEYIKSKLTVNEEVPID